MPRYVARKHLGKYFLGDLDQSLRPARLLRLECRHFHRQLSRTFDVLQINKLPSFKLRAIGEIGIFGERVVLPSAGFVNGATPPHAGRAVEVEENAAARPSRVFQHEMPVEQNGFDLGQQRVVAVDVRPARLHHADLGIGEVMNALHQKIGRRNKISVKNGNELALRRFQSFRQSARLEALAIVAVQVVNRMSQGGIAIDQETSDLHGFVGRIVEQLDVELFFRIVEPAHGVKQPVYYVLLIKDRQLHRDARQVIRMKMRRGCRGLLFFVLVIKIDQPVAVRPVRRQNDQHDEIGNQQRQVKRIDLVKALESLVQKMVAKVRPQALGGQQEDHSQRGRSESQFHELSRTAK